MHQGYDQVHSHVLDCDAQLHYEGDTFRTTETFHNLWGDPVMSDRIISKENHFKIKQLQSDYNAAQRMACTAPLMAVGEKLCLG